MSESMVNRPDSQSSPARDSWLEVIDSDSPLLLIAPHGGRAEPRTRALLNPKVNDLHTADITRTLANRLGASALINVGMDRNRLDCNRLSQIIEQAPWLLEMISGSTRRSRRASRSRNRAAHSRMEHHRAAHRSRPRAPQPGR